MLLGSISVNHNFVVDSLQPDRVPLEFGHASQFSVLLLEELVDTGKAEQFFRPQHWIVRPRLFLGFIVQLIYFQRQRACPPGSDWVGTAPLPGVSGLGRWALPLWGGAAPKVQIIMSSRESGGTGRRARLRIWSRKGWGFESPLSHQTPYRCRIFPRC